MIIASSEDIGMDYEIPHLCPNCKKKIPLKKKYCSNACQAEFQYKSYIQRWKHGLETGLKGQYSVSNHVKRYLFEKYNCKCTRCGWSEINPYTGNIPLEAHHIDGDYSHTVEDNLELICPNCHSLTPTYKAANKGKGRKERRKYDLK
jgi:hypothetical protein